MFYTAFEVVLSHGIMSWIDPLLSTQFFHKRNVGSIVAVSAAVMVCSASSSARDLWHARA